MSRFSLTLATLLWATSAVAGVPSPRGDCKGSGDVGVPEPPRSAVEIHGQTVACHFRFDPGPVGDVLIVAVTLRDAFDAVVPEAEVWAVLTPNAGTVGLCGCCPLRRSGFTDAAGTARFEFAQLGGYGSVDVCVTSSVDCLGNPVVTALACRPIDFTSPDLDATCESRPDHVASVVDLGIWANGLTFNLEYADYNCDGTVDVVDLGTWARGLIYGCGDATCP